MKSLGKFYRFLNYVSVDVACGAMVCASFFSNILHVQLRDYVLSSLGITVWIIYTLDHLIDVRKMEHEASSPRHRFHQNNFWRLLWVLILAATIDLLLVVIIYNNYPEGSTILICGTGLAFVVLLYLWFQQKLVVFKELVGSILYSAGILIPTLSMTSKMPTIEEFILMVFFTLTAFINLILFSWYDWNHDLTDNQSSIVTFLGRSYGKNILVILFLIQIVLFLLLIISPYWLEALILLFMNVALSIIFLFPEKFLKKDLYRIIGDIVFLTPLPYILFP